MITLNVTSRASPFLWKTNFDKKYRSGRGGGTEGQIDTLPSNLLRVNEKYKFAGLLRAYLKFYTILSERTSDK